MKELLFILLIISSFGWVSGQSSEEFDDDTANAEQWEDDPLLPCVRNDDDDVYPFSHKIEAYELPAQFPKTFDSLEEPAWKEHCKDSFADRPEQSKRCGDCFAHAITVSSHMRACIDTKIDRVFSVNHTSTCSKPRNPPLNACYGGSFMDILGYVVRFQFLTSGSSSRERQIGCQAYQLPICFKGDKDCPQLEEGQMLDPGPCDNNFCQDKTEITPNMRYPPTEKGNPVGIFESKGSVFINAMKAEIQSRGPVVTYLNTNEKDQTVRKYKKGEIIRKVGKYADNKPTHMSVVTGWGVQIIKKKEVEFWRILNVWGRKYGDNGFFNVEIGKNLLQMEQKYIFLRTGPEPIKRRVYKKEYLSLTGVYELLYCTTNEQISICPAGSKRLTYRHLEFRRLGGRDAEYPFCLSAVFFSPIPEMLTCLTDCYKITKKRLMNTERNQQCSEHCSNILPESDEMRLILDENGPVHISASSYKYMLLGFIPSLAGVQIRSPSYDQYYFEDITRKSLIKPKNRGGINYYKSLMKYKAAREPIENEKDLCLRFALEVVDNEMKKGPCHFFQFHVMGQVGEEQPRIFEGVLRREIPKHRHSVGILVLHICVSPTPVIDEFWDFHSLIYVYNGKHPLHLSEKMLNCRFLRVCCGLADWKQLYKFKGWGLQQVSFAKRAPVRLEIIEDELKNFLEDKACRKMTSGTHIDCTLPEEGVKSVLALLEGSECTKDHQKEILLLTRKDGATGALVSIGHDWNQESLEKCDNLHFIQPFEPILMDFLHLDSYNMTFDVPL